MKGRVCIFAKTPKLGYVKTRLEGDIGKQGSLDLHKWLVEDRLQLTSSELDAEFQIHVTESVDDGFWKTLLAVNKNVSIHYQVGESLGDRMCHVSTTADLYPWTILIGADCPDLDEHYLRRAIDSLNNNSDVVVGPAEDGGYVLLGFKTHIPELFQSIDWGTDQVLSQTLSILEDQSIQDKIIRYSKLGALRDLDVLDDLQYYAEKHPELNKLFFASSSMLS